MLNWRDAEDHIFHSNQQQQKLHAQVEKKNSSFTYTKEINRQ